MKKGLIFLALFLLLFPVISAAEIELLPKFLEVSMDTDSQLQGTFYLNNLGETDIENISLKVSEILDFYITLSTYRIRNLKANSREKIEILILSSGEEATIEGSIFVTSENATTNSSLILSFVKGFILPGESGQENPFENICSEVGGEICGEGFECNGKVFYTNEGVCCLESCFKKIDTKELDIKSLGLILIIITLVLAFLFYRLKYKK